MAAMAVRQANVALSRAYTRSIPSTLAQVSARAVHVAVESTPNEHSLKFSPANCVVLREEQGTGIHYSEEGGAAGSPLARRVFQVPGVTSVFLGPSFVSVNKVEDAVWDELRHAVASVISDAFDEGLAAVEVLPDVEDAVVYDPEDAEVVELISEIMDSRIRPTVQEDGGDVVFVGYSEGVVQLQLAGSCVGCASSSETLYNGIESMLQYYVPEVTRIEQVFSTSQAVGQAEFEVLEEKLAASKQGRAS